VLALPLGALLSEQRITRRDVLASSLVALALGAFLVLSNPEAGIDEPSAAAASSSGPSTAPLGDRRSIYSRSPAASSPASQLKKTSTRVTLSAAISAMNETACSISAPLPLILPR
jgi:hypothetical protein